MKVKDEDEGEDKYPELAALDEKLMISPAVALGEVATSVAAMSRRSEEHTSEL